MRQSGSLSATQKLAEKYLLGPEKFQVSLLVAILDYALLPTPWPVAVHNTAPRQISPKGPIRKHRAIARVAKWPARSPLASLYFFRNALSKSIGNGRKVVVLCSLAISRMV